MGNATRQYNFESANFIFEKVVIAQAPIIGLFSVLFALDKVVHTVFHSSPEHMAIARPRFRIAAILLAQCLVRPNLATLIFFSLLFWGHDCWSLLVAVI